MAAQKKQQFNPRYHSVPIVSQNGNLLTVYLTSG